MSRQSFTTWLKAVKLQRRGNSNVIKLHGNGDVPAGFNANADHRSHSRARLLLLLALEVGATAKLWLFSLLSTVYVCKACFIGHRDSDKATEKVL